MGKRRAKIDNLHFHDLRHEAISRFFEKGLSTPEVALISGHRDMRMCFVTPTPTERKFSRSWKRPPRLPVYQEEGLMLTQRFDEAFRYAHGLHQAQTRK